MLRVPIEYKSNNVKLNLDSLAIQHMMFGLHFIAQDHSVVLPPKIVITSGNDSTHGDNSRHYKDEAMDVRAKNFPSRESKRAFRTRLEEILGAKFRVLIECEGQDNEHFHIQVRKGLNYP